MVNAYARATAVERADRWLSVMEKDETCRENWGQKVKEESITHILMVYTTQITYGQIEDGGSYIVFLRYTSEMLVPMGKIMIN